ncbi:uncharacterized protein PHACADRAFT_256532 [Phanerochaete carnosa HHB-10118-sp]|uniref:Uncharacterized protein n=1 Tax=Phanerochaete carnosa (strain HHB-10118-sp) TaxID=650164 RepID=K5VVY2_PHACS|nr:uncharacterized protein PHACADRAFT_256532 [Phanerochaete carnosa HHB-10118-sp]EKM55713.1 hypothetical protein PHACADRAFT_256532 [Phanerochaete carnosa HHB-10118-sp]
MSERSAYLCERIETAQKRRNYLIVGQDNAPVILASPRASHNYALLIIVAVTSMLVPASTHASCFS